MSSTLLDIYTSGKPLDNPQGYHTLSFFGTINSNKNTIEGRDIIERIHDNFASILNPSITINNKEEGIQNGPRDDSNTLNIHVTLRKENSSDGRFHLHFTLNIITMVPNTAFLDYNTFRTMVNDVAETKVYIQLKKYANNDLRSQLYIHKQTSYQGGNFQEEVNFNMD